MGGGELRQLGGGVAKALGAVPHLCGGWAWGSRANRVRVSVGCYKSACSGGNGRTLREWVRGRGTAHNHTVACVRRRTLMHATLQSQPLQQQE